MKKMSTNRLLVGGIIMVITTIAIVVYISIRQSQRVNDTSALVAHTEEVLRNIQKLEIAVMDNETGARGYVITGKDNFLEPLYLSEQKLTDQSNEIAHLVKDNPVQTEKIKTLDKLIRLRIDFSREMISVRKNNGLDSAIAMVEGGAGKRYSDRIREIGHSMEQLENTLLQQRRKENDRTISSLNLILYVVLAAVLLLTIIAVAFLKKHIDQQRANEEKFKALLDAAPDATVIVDEKGIIRMANLQTKNLFDYNREELVGKSVEILVPEGIRHQHGGHRKQFYQQPKVRSMGVGIELNAVKKDGVLFPVEISLSPIQTSEGLWVSASVRDISARKQLEDALRKTNAELEAFTYSVSHDLRAPLRGIVGFTTILEEDYANRLDDEAKRITGIIRSNTIKMGSLVDDLLAFSRMGKQELLKTKVNMQVLVEEILRDMRDRDQYKAEVQVQGLLPEIRADLNTIRQVWVNLLSNAIKYSSLNPAPVVKVGYDTRPGEYVFYVQDNGVGFDNKYKDKLFRVFQRLHSPEEFEGTGVGLALVDKIISRHGGKVWAEGEVDKGAVFYFSLPIA